MSPEQLKIIMPLTAARAGAEAPSRAEIYAPLLTAAMKEFEIDTSKRQAAFLAQVAHESGSLKYTAEIASGSAYEGRQDLGNVIAGDGVRYKGRGLMQITGRRNYQTSGLGLDLPLIEFPELLESPSNAARSAGWYWKHHKLNTFADANRFGALTRAINGGYNHLDERIGFWIVARKVLGL
jgi:putative chitinase